MVFQILASGPHSVQRLSSAEDPDPDPVSSPKIPVVGDEDDAGEDRLCSVVDSADISCDSVLCWVPAGVVTAWATVADWAVSPLGLVVCCGSVNWLSWVAAAEEAA